MCNCIQEMNELLEEAGLSLDLVFFSDNRPSRIKVPVTVIDAKKRKGKPTATIIPSYCVFCGEEIEE